MASLLNRTLCCALVAAALTACADDERSPHEVAEGDACGDAYFWGTTESGDIAVTIGLEIRERSSTEPTTVEFDIPDDDVDVAVLEGHELARNFCTDVIDGNSEPSRRHDAVAGHGVITLGPQLDTLDGGCGSVSGVLELNGLEAEDGTTFTPIRIASTSIGCYSG